MPRAVDKLAGAKVSGLTRRAKYLLLDVGSGTVIMHLGMSGSLRLVEHVVDIEKKIGIPVTSSNHAMAWHCLRLAGVYDRLPEFGRLYEE